ncbi:hypothetical protein KC19_4G001800 [Ceratodon purpureus]|uniref:Uncharacterized protein n=1 Tax=Ceratodon purpureus TaxID=3225 RepID=A0A8T0I3S1_CERPU|nr:hypothetical protein KC19_4G001800 [Ceratodon purpureus]
MGKPAGRGVRAERGHRVVGKRWQWRWRGGGRDSSLANSIQSLEGLGRWAEVSVSRAGQGRAGQGRFKCERGRGRDGMQSKCKGSERSAVQCTASRSAQIHTAGT